MSDPVYDPIAAFAGTLQALGVRDVVISPGSRSTPLSVAFHAHPGLRTHIQLDERSAGFFALGQARLSGRPSVLICTSGTAAANYLPAVVEANHAGVPLIVCTADRPPELRDWGAGQTIDQVNLFGSNVRWFADLPVPSEWTEAGAGLAARRAWAQANGSRRGPVHLNWPLRQPLEPIGAIPCRQFATDTVVPLVAAPYDLSSLLHGRGLIVVGPDAASGLSGQQELADHLVAVAQARGWPIVGEPLSQIRRHQGPVIANAEQLFATGLVDDLRPDVVVQVGASPTTKPLRLWLERVRPERVVLVDPEQRWHDPSSLSTDQLAIDPISAVGWFPTNPEPSADDDQNWLTEWCRRDDQAGKAIDAVLAVSPTRSSASVVRDLVAGVPAGSLVVTSNSMPVRDLDSFVPAGTPLGFLGNRGTSGIDGIPSTALGCATQTDVPVVVFTGDLALLHDVGGLLAGQRAGVHLTVVCIDNDGGAIFSMLPIHQQAEAVDYETLFRTRHGVDLAELDGLAGVRVHTVDAGDDLAELVAECVQRTTPGVDVVLVTIEPDGDMALRRACRDAVNETAGS